MQQTIQQISIKKHIPKQQLSPFQLIPYIIAIIKPHHTSTVITILRQYQNKNININQCHVCETVDHGFLKTVKKSTTDNDCMQVIVGLKECQQVVGKMQAIRQYVIQQVIIDLPQYRPITKQQYRQWIKLWPVNFIQPQHIKQPQYCPKLLHFLTAISNNLQQYPHDYYLFNTNNNHQILLSISGQCNPDTIQHPIMTLLQQWPQSQIYKANNNYQECKDVKQMYYYLTKLSIVARRQICGMCAMALVHSRLQGMYCVGGKVGEVMGRVMGCRGLNHQVSLYQCQ